MLRISGLEQHYGGSRTLRGVELDVPQGGCVAVMGRNGVGKTTLLRCAMGELPASAGWVRFAGEDVTRLPPWERARRGMGYVPQGREIFARLTVAENLAVGAAACREPLPRGELEALFPMLREMKDRRGGDLSGGQQQQLAIARALIARPRMLLLDEPTEGIQPSTIKEIGRVLKTLLAKGLTIVLVEQYLDFALELADRFAIVSRGAVAMSGLMKDLDRAEAQRHLALG